MLPEYFEFTLPTKLVYGVGILGNIGNTVKHFGKRRAILVTDKILVKAGPVNLVKKGFKNTNIEIVCKYDNVPPNSTIKTVNSCARLAKKTSMRFYNRHRRRQRHRHGQGRQSSDRQRRQGRGSYGCIPAGQR